MALRVRRLPLLPTARPQCGMKPARQAQGGAAVRWAILALQKVALRYLKPIRVCQHRMAQLRTGCSAVTTVRGKVVRSQVRAAVLCCCRALLCCTEHMKAVRLCVMA